MRLTFIAIFCLLFTAGFSQEIQSQSENLPQYPLRQIINYCQSDTLTPVSYTKLVYDEGHKLVKSTFYYDTVYKYIKEFEYDQKGLLSKIYSYELSKGERSREYILLFTYNKSSQLITEAYENQPNSAYQQNEYNNKGLLYIHKVIGPNWREETIFDYDADGRLIKKDIGYSTLVTYKYDQNKLIKERIHTKTKPNTEILYEYTNSGKVLIKKEDGKTIERNTYQNDRLIKQWSNYYGIDPCISRPCCMQTISCFEYY